MSLLLDALKKAADKKKDNEVLSVNSCESDKSSDKQKMIEVDLDIDLDLDLEIDNKDEGFPIVDVVIEAEKILINKSDDALLGDDKKNTNIHLISDKNTEVEQGEVKICEDLNFKEELNKGITKEIDKVGVEKKAETNKIKDKQEDLYNQEEKEEALSALINKSNFYTKNKKVKTRITFGIFVLVGLIGAAAYYYIEFSSSTQKLFTAYGSTPELKEQTIVNRKEIELVNTASQKVKKIVKFEFEKTPTRKNLFTKKVEKMAVPATKKSIKFIHKTVEDPVDVLVRQAYDAFVNNDFKKSNVLYKKVLNTESRNRDALLGLAAIAIKQKRYEYARLKYLNLLKLDPKDSFALAGLSALGGRIDPQMNESQLKFMLKEQPDAAHLYFALGSHYVTQKKWAEAQSAFFSAWSAENKNADYCYNLAVSLDHLGKNKSAKDYYKLSLKLKKLKGGNFSEKDTEQRVQYLQERDS